MIAAAGCAGPAAVAQVREPLVIAVGRLTLSLPFYVAEAEGLFEREGVTVRFEDCAYGRVCLERLLEGKAQLATVSESPIVLAGTKGERFAILSTVNSSRNDVKIVARRSSGIRSAVDLAGKRIGVFVGTTAHYYLHLAMLLAGGDPADARLVPLQASDDVAARLKTGELDAVALFEPFGYAAIKGIADDAVVISSSIYVQIFNLVASRQVVGLRDQDLERLLRALHHAILFLEANPQRARDILRTRLKMDDDEIDWAWRGLRFGLNLEKSLLHALEGQARWALRFGYTRGSVPNFREYLYPGPLARVRPEGLKLTYNQLPGGAAKSSR